MGSPAISPDGTRLVYIARHQGKPLVALRDLTTNKDNGLLDGVADKLRVGACWFKNDERVICSFRGTVHDFGMSYPVSRLVAINVDGAAQKVLLQRSAAATSQFHDRVLHTLPDDRSHVLIAVNDPDTIYPGVFKLDVYTGAMELVQRARSPVMEWIADSKGAIRFGSGYVNRSALYIARDNADAPWRTLEKFQRFEASFSPLGYGSLPGTLLVSVPHNGRDAIWELDLDDKKSLQLVYAHPEVDVSSAIHWPDGRLVGFEYETDKPQQHFIDPAAESISITLNQALPGRINTVIDGSKDGKRLLVVSYSDVKPPAYYVLDLTGKTLKSVGETNSALRNVALAPMTTVTVPGPDGVKIPGYLTMPLGKDPKNLPTIVYPHGGPYVRDSWGYDPVVQMMASRGYAVLQLNFRGSTGYGSDWFEAGFQKWGTVMHDDITAGARWVIAQGIADPARLCIVGWSYGGYAAMIGAAKEPTLYKCAVSIAGVSDAYQLHSDDARFYGGRDAIRNSTGDDKKELNSVSPRRNAEQIKAPVLLVHGDDDITVLVDHSKAMSKALTRAGVKNELVIIKDGDHSLSRGEWRSTLFSKMDAFLATHLGGT